MRDIQSGQILGGPLNYIRESKRLAEINIILEPIHTEGLCAPHTQLQIYTKSPCMFIIILLCPAAFVS